ncbi:MAG: aminopeptidase P family protein [Thermoanaerobaculia bacterium]
MHDFAGRRRRFAELLGGAPAVVPAARVLYRSRDTQHVFRQDSDFAYLTGYPEPDAVAVFHGDAFYLAVRPRDSVREAWDGARLGVEAVESYGAIGCALEKLPDLLASCLSGSGRIGFPLRRNPRLDRWLSEFLASRTGLPSPELFDPSVPISELRLVKEPSEIELLEKAARISSGAHARAAEAIRPGIYEYQVQALLEFHFRDGGASGPAYPSIVASGANATTLHYHENTRKIEEKDTVLIDAGAEFALYASDVTRTIGASGAPTGERGALGEVVAAAQREAIDECRAGRTFDDVHGAAQRVLARGLRDFGILDGSAEEILATDRQKPFTIHRTSHWLGLDVHDPGSTHPGGSPRVLRPGMVLTVEPGLYFREGSGAPARWLGLGARIEDDVLITSDAPRVLSRD